MTELDYESIVDRIIKLKSEELNEWESDFLDSIYMKNLFPVLTDAQKEKIIQINRKYIAGR